MYVDRHSSGGVYLRYRDYSIAQTSLKEYSLSSSYLLCYQLRSTPPYTPQMHQPKGITSMNWEILFAFIHDVFII